MFELIRINKRNSILLVSLIVLLAVVVGYVISRAMGAGGYVGVVFALGIASVMSFSAYFYGDKVVLASSGARHIQKEDDPQLFNVVDEMSVASGLPMPKVYIIDDTAPNAFATGRNPEKASVAITTGLMEKLTRDELQGVMAHEMSHIRNYDILYATLVGVLVGTIALMCDLFLRYTRFSMLTGGSRRRRSSRKKGSGGGAEALFLILAIVLAILAPLIARLVQMAVSREREYLADASAAELTRYPDGLASALEKISGDQEVLEVANRATQHLYIVNPVKSFEERSKNLFSTHPPTSERIKRLRSI